MKRLFQPGELSSWGLPDQAAIPLEETGDENVAVVYLNEVTDVKGFTEVRDLVFRAPDDGRLWRVTYKSSFADLLGIMTFTKTSPWGDDQYVPGTEVIPFQVTVTRYRDVRDTGGLDEDHDHELV